MTDFIPLSVPTIRPIQQADNQSIARVIRQVLLEMEVPKVGSAYADPSLDFLYDHYRDAGGAYFVAEINGEIIAGAGFGSLPGEDSSYCELQKMYILPAARCMGLGQRLIETCLAAARESGYSKCYLETLPNMQAAQHLYKKMGFVYLDKPLGNTGHHACQVRMLLEL